MEQQAEQAQGTTSRRAFMLAAGAGAVSTGVLAKGLPAFAADSSRLAQGDADILRFLSAAEILEADLWQQYNELGGVQDAEVPGGTGNDAYTEALEQLDDDMPQYIHDNTEDEFTHFKFINAYLESKGAAAVNLEPFRTLPSSTATGAQQIGRLTNLMELTVDTSWWTRYRDPRRQPRPRRTRFPPAVPGLAPGRFPAIPRDDDDLTPAEAHPGDRQHGGIPLRVHRAGRHQPLPGARPAGHQPGGVADPAQHRPNRGDALPDLARQGGQRASADRPHERADVPGPQCTAVRRGGLQTDLIMPEPCPFLSRRFPAVRSFGPTETKGAAMGAVKA